MSDYVENYMVVDEERYLQSPEPLMDKCAYCGEFFDPEESDADDGIYCCEDCEEKDFIRQSRERTFDEAREMGAKI